MLLEDDEVGEWEEDSHGWENEFFILTEYKRQERAEFDRIRQAVDCKRLILQSGFSARELAQHVILPDLVKYPDILNSGHDVINSEKVTHQDVETVTHHTLVWQGEGLVLVHKHKRTR